MNSQNAHLFIPLVQALADGKKILRDGIDCGPEVNFLIDPKRYEIKSEPPKPREWKGTVVSRYGDSRTGNYGFRIELKGDKIDDAPNPGEVLTLREVIPES